MVIADEYLVIGQHITLIHQGCCKFQSKGA